MLLAQRFLTLLMCFCTFVRVKFITSTSILQGLTKNSSSWEDDYFHKKSNHVAVMNFSFSENTSNGKPLQSILQSVDLSRIAEKELIKPKNLTCLTQMFHISRSNRGKRTAVDLMIPTRRRNRKLRKVLGMHKMEASKTNLRPSRRKLKRKKKTFAIPLPFPNGDRDKDSIDNVTGTNDIDIRPQRRKSKRKHRKLSMPLPFPNGEFSEVQDINNVISTANDSYSTQDELNSSTRIPDTNHSSNIGIVESGAEQFTIAVNKDFTEENTVLPVKRVKIHKVKSVKIPLPFNSAPKISFEEPKSKEEEEVAVIRTKRHKKRKRKRLPPLN